MNRRILLGCRAGALAAALLPPWLHAAGTEPADSIGPARDLGQVVVTATRTPRPLKDVPVPTRVITARDLERLDAADVQDALEQEVPGLEFTYAMDQQTSLRLSGFGGSSVLFLVDGERMAGETLDNVDYARLTLDDVERIEIVKGAASTLYGSQAVGGVVNLITREPDEPWSLSLHGRYGTVGEGRGGASLGLRRGRWSSRTSLGRSVADAVRLSESDALTRIYAHDEWHARQRLAFRLTERLALTGRASYFRRQRRPGGDTHERYYDYAAGLKAEWQPTDDDAVELSYAFDQYDKSDFSRLSRLNIRDYSNVQHTTHALYSHTFAARHTLTLGGDYMRDYLMSYQFADGGAHVQHTADVFAQLDCRPTDRWSVLAGLRGDYISSLRDPAVTAKLAAMRKWTRASLRASYAGGFRAPTLKEMFMVFNMADIFMIYGNDALRPERSHHLSLTAEHGGALRTAGRYDLSLSAYGNLVRDRIATAWHRGLPSAGGLAAGGMQYVNQDAVRTCGLDATATATLSGGWTLHAAYNYTREHVGRGRPVLSAQRPHSLTARLSYDRRLSDRYGLGATLSGRGLSAVEVDEYVSVTDNSATQRVRYPGYALWKLSLAQRFRRGVTLTAAVDNLFGYVPSTYYNNSPATTGTTFSLALTLDVHRMFGVSE